jgi:3-oxoacyl-(acyl-carrier-protein) synthase III
VKPFRLNRHQKLVFPSSIFIDLDFSVIRDLDHLQAIIRRDFEVKAPTGTEIAAIADQGDYRNRYELLRDLGLHLFWANRFALTMYDKRPTRWRDVPRNRDDVYVPLQVPWADREAKVASVRAAYADLPARWDDDLERDLFDQLIDVYANKLYLAAELPAIKPTITEALATPDGATTVLGAFDPDHPRFPVDEILNVSADQPELEALQRWAMVLHNQHPWDRSKATLKKIADFDDDDIVVTFHPRNRDVYEFIQRVRWGIDGSVGATSEISGIDGGATNDRAVSDRRGRGGNLTSPSATEPPEPVEPTTPLAPFIVGSHPERRAKIDALAVRRGEHVCSNDDVVRNAPPSWSPMSPDEITVKTGIEQRLYTSQPLENIALEAARDAMAHAELGPADIGAVLFCSCTSSRLIPSTACWISGQLGIAQTHASADIVAACAGFPYGMAEAIRLLGEVERPVLVVMAEKFSDKIGNARPSRMIFGDGAAAMIVSPATDRHDVEVVQTYASGPVSQVNSIIWPNPDFDNDITVYGPEVKAMVKRYLEQMLGELSELDSVRHRSNGVRRALLNDIDTIVPHQANRTMIVDIAEAQNVEIDKLYFNIAQVGNVSAASIPLAMADAVADGTIGDRQLLFAPGFGAGAVGGYVVTWFEPSMVAPERAPATAEAAAVGAEPVEVS